MLQTSGLEKQAAKACKPSEEIEAKIKTIK
jgi:hypothetical protein